MLFCGPYILNLSRPRNQSNGFWPPFVQVYSSGDLVPNSHGPRITRLVNFNRYYFLHHVILALTQLLITIT